MSEHAMPEETFLLVGALSAPHEPAMSPKGHTTMNQNNKLIEITRDAFKAYNAGGPPERANLTHDGKPVPPFEALGANVAHKWNCAASAAALAGAEHVIDMLRAMDIPVSAELRGNILATLDAPPWQP